MQKYSRYICHILPACLAPVILFYTIYISGETEREPLLPAFT